MERRNESEKKKYKEELHVEKKEEEVGRKGKVDMKQVPRNGKKDERQKIRENQSEM